jgi:exosortase/archaeosortase family protein
LAVAVNGLRVAITAITTYAFGPVAVEGLVHEALGCVMFLFALVILVAWARGVARWRRVVVLEPAV